LAVPEDLDGDGGGVVAVLVLGFASAEKETAVTETAQAPTADVMMVLKEQRQMMAQLLDSAPAPMDRCGCRGRGAK